MVELLFGLWGIMHVFMYIWVCASKILSVRFLFPQGRISLTNVSERKDKMRLGMTLASNPKDNSFVVSLKHINTMAMVKMEKNPQDCLLITWLSYCSFPYGSSLRTWTKLFVICKGRWCCIYQCFLLCCYSGLWATMVLWVWQLLLQHWHMLKSQCELQVLQNDCACISE